MSAKVLKSDFQINVGCVDSFIRIFVGLIFLTGSLMGLLGTWALAGGVLVVTGLSRYSPLYVLLKFNTIRCDRENAH